MPTTPRPVDDPRSGGSPPAEAGAAGSAIRSAIIVGLCAAVLIFHAGRYLPFFTDDAFISLRYARRFIDGHGLSWADGRPVEGYSNFLWIILIAALGRCGLDLVLAARLLGVTLTIAGVAAISRLIRVRTRSSGLPALAGGLTFALSVPIAVWSVGGLEQPLVLCLLAWILVLLRATERGTEPSAARLLTASLLLGLFCLARPDGPVLVAAVAVALVVSRGLGRRPRRASALLVGVPILFIIGHECFRLAYYGEWLPNTAYAKIVPSLDHVRRGIEYVGGAFRAMMPLSLVAVVLGLAALWDKRSRTLYAMLWSIAAAWTIYLALIGGDIFAAWRQWTPVVLVIAAATGDGVARLLHRWPGSRAKLGIAALLAAAMVWFVANQKADQVNCRALANQSEWDGQVVGLMLKSGFGAKSPTIAVDAAGSVPYWSELPAIDMLGLNDHYIPRHPPPGLGRGFLGHELGDGAYVLGRAPDLILFKDPLGRRDGAYLSGIQMQALPDFRRRYVLIQFEGRQPYPVRSLIWVDRFSSRIGIQAANGLVEAPAYLLNANPDTVAFLDSPGRFVIPIAGGGHAGIDALPLASGRWRASVEASRPLTLLISSSADGARLAAGLSPVEFRLADFGSSAIDVRLHNDGDRAVDLTKLTLSRLGE